MERSKIDKSLIFYFSIISCGSGASDFLNMEKGSTIFSVGK